MTSALLEMYLRLINQAQAKNAVLVLPWWCHHDTNIGAQLFLRALDLACYRGPLVNVSVEPWTLVHKADKELFNFRLAGSTEITDRRSVIPVMRRATHTILVKASRTGYENTATSFRIAAELAKHLSTTPNHSAPVVAFMVNGGRNSIYSAAASSLIGIPLLVIQGSGRLADYLPDAWLR